MEGKAWGYTGLCMGELDDTADRSLEVQEW